MLLKEGIDIDLVKSACLAFLIIGFLIFSINITPILKKRIPNYTLQLAGLIGNTSFLGIPIAIALLPSKTINFTIGFDLGTTLFAWIFGPFLLNKRTSGKSILNVKGLFYALINSPALKGILGVLIVYIFQMEVILGNYLWIPARIVIVIAIIVVGARLGIITNQKDNFFDLGEGIKYSIFLKIIFMPTFVFLIFSSVSFLSLIIWAPSGHLPSVI